MANQQEGVGVGRFVEIWSRRKWIAVVAFLVTLSLAASISTFLPDAYRSTVTLLVESQQVPSEIVRSTVTSGVERRVQTIAQAILSRERLEGLIKEFSLYQDLTVEENLTFFATVFNTTIEENYDLIKDIYQQIEPFKTRKAGALSGGMKQKLALTSTHLCLINSI